MPHTLTYKVKTTFYQWLIYWFSVLSNLLACPMKGESKNKVWDDFKKNWWREKDYYDYDQADALMNKKIQSVYILCVHRIHTGIIVKQMCTWSCSYYKNRYMISDTSQKLFDHHSDRSIWTTTMGSVQTIDLPKWMNHCFTHSHHKCPYYRILFLWEMRTIFFA